MMTYRVEYHGTDVEVPTLAAAIEDAKRAIEAHVGPVTEWTVEHDDAINDWFVQGVVDGKPIGATAVVAGPEPTVADPLAPHRPGGAGAAAPEQGGWLRSIAFAGGTPAEAFGMATTWLAGRPDAVAISDVGWQAADRDGLFHLRIHYHGGPPA